MMLVLSRKQGETVVVECGGANVEVTVVDVRGDKIRIGFNAPREVVIHRKEVWDKIRAGESRP